MTIVLSKKDIIWSYAAQFFSIATGFFTLPLILHLLTAEEIGMNYLMLTISSLVTLFDFGFAPQFARNISYVFSGVQSLKREGVDLSAGNEINYKLLSNTISTAQFVYRRLAIIVLITMLTGGTAYIFYVTAGFSNVKNSFLIWIIYSVSTFFNIYYTYFNSLLIGKGLIMESKKSMVYSRITYLILVFTLLVIGYGLISVVIANLIAPFVSRFFAYRYFFTDGLKLKLEENIVSREEQSELFKVVWHNSKKLGLVYIGSYAITKFSIFLAGLFLSLQDIASYGLMTQLVGILLMISTTLFNSYIPTFSSLRVKPDKGKLIKVFAFTMNIYYLLFLVGALLLICFVPSLLILIKSKAILPSQEILILYTIIILLDGNHSCFSTFITTNNRIPFVKPALIVGFLMAIFDYVVLAYTSLGILGLVLVQGILQLAYSNWKWPCVVCKEFGISFFYFLNIGRKEALSKLMKYSYGGKQ